MDAKITKKRLNIFLSYDWIKILLAAVAAILVWSLIFTTAATRVTQAQNFTIFNYTGTKGTSRFNVLNSPARKERLFLRHFRNFEYGHHDGRAVQRNAVADARVDGRRRRAVRGEYQRGRDDEI